MGGDRVRDGLTKNVVSDMVREKEEEMSPGQVLYEWLDAEDFHHNDHQTWDDLSPSDKRFWESAAGAVLDAMCDWDGG